MSGDEKKGGEKQEFTPPASQDDLNKIIEERLKRERAKFADYDELKTKAATFDQLQDAKKTDEQKLLDRISGLESKLSETEATAAKARIQAKYKISDEDAELFLTHTDPEKLEAQAKALAEREGDRRKKGPVLPGQRNLGPDLKPDPLREIAQQIFPNS